MSQSIRQPSIGVVVIGRNEGERLKRCLRALAGQVERMVYVDSGSTDGSAAFARSVGAEVVELDMTRPFTMGRGRNAGFEHLTQVDPHIDFVQFVDGDCEVAAGWIEAARAALTADDGLAAVCGRRRERFPDASIYNRLCDMEWDVKPGEAKACGGDALMRAAAFAQVGGFNAGMIAGEEGELCLRLRGRGWRIQRIACEMTLHDAAMSRFGQWWKRTVRAGHAYAEGMALHRRTPGRYNVRPVTSSLIWGFAMPAMAVAGVALAFFTPWALLLTVLIALAAGLTWAKLLIRTRRGRQSTRDGVLFATFCLLAKLPQAIGVVWFWWNRLRGRRSGLIEYKTQPLAA